MIDLEALTQQVAGITVTSEDGDHVVQMYQSKFIRTDEGSVSVQQASRLIATGEWSTASPTCGVDDCIRPDHLEAADLALVSKHTQAVSLADLYRKAKGRGLLTPRTSYGG